ncbi:hypothetical protein GQX74_011698 [Glossina fuscipes]|nr:hypothetical protein GQX74_011698 [Glossina fuscipes]
MELENIVANTVYLKAREGYVRKADALNCLKRQRKRTVSLRDPSIRTIEHNSGTLNLQQNFSIDMKFTRPT